MKKTVKKISPKSGPAEAHPSFAPVVKAFINDRQVTAGMMMSSYGLKVKGKIFAMFVKGRLVVKLPKHRVDAIVDGGEGKRFDPGHGRLMQEWVVVLTHERSWIAIAKEACHFVKSTKV